MNLFKKGFLTLLVAGLIMSCADDILSPSDVSSTGSGLTQITLSSFSADDSGDGTVITVKPLAVGGVSSYVVDFGDPDSEEDVVTITDPVNGTASYDYPNDLEKVKYTITVTAKSEGKADVSKSKEIEVEHSVTAVSSAIAATDFDVDVYSIYSNGTLAGDAFASYSTTPASFDVDNGSAQYAELTVGTLGNKVLQYSRLRGDVAASISITHIATQYDVDGNVTEEAKPLVVADAFGSGIAATKFHVDLQSDYAVGVDKVLITLVDDAASVEYTYEADLTDGEWVSLALELATDFSAPVVQINSVKFQLASSGSANDAATLNVDNLYFTKIPDPIPSEIVNGDFGDSDEYGRTDKWSIAAFSGGTTSPFNSSSDGSWTDYDGVLGSSKTGGAKFTNGTSAGPKFSSSTRIAYQALQLTAGSEYILEYEYAIKNDEADEPVGGRRIVGNVLSGIYSDGADIFGDDGFPLSDILLNYHLGNVAEGKFSATVGTKVLIPFTAPADGKISVMFYAVTPKDGWIDNVKVYEAP